MRFAHFGDVHLGYHQYGLDQRAQDIANAFLWVCNKVNEERCDFAILSGDLFHHRYVDPVSLSVASEGLRIINCPIYMIKGNHEKMRTAYETDWIDYLVSEKLVILAEPTGVSFYMGEHCRQKDRRHNHYVTVFGVDWVGMATDQIVSNLVIPSGFAGDFFILMLHAGMEDVLPKNHPGMLSYETIRKFMDRVDYVALGHIHKPHLDGWIFNGGSLETIASDEYKWPDRGLIVVDVNEDKSFTTQLHVPPRRSFFTHTPVKDGIPFDPRILFKDAVVIVNGTQADVDFIKANSDPLYIKLNLVKDEKRHVEVQPSLNKVTMELDAIKQLTDLPSEKVLDMKGLKDGKEIWSTADKLYRA
jgi:DNA repair exonuclease SbcCD nuclease subunit